MQKLLISAAVGALVLTGCATNNTQDVKPAPQEMQGKHKYDKKDGKPHHGKMTESYTCENNGKITAKYNPDTEQALLNIHAPTLGLNNADVEMKLAQSGSGMRFVNEVNPASKYAWHAKGKMGLLDVTTADGKTYSLTCEGTRPMHKHAHDKR